MRESTVERYLGDRAEVNGGVSEKFKSPGKRGVPDRIVSWPYGFKDWVEVKRPKGPTLDHQRRDHARRRAMGHRVWVCHTKEQVDDYITVCAARHRTYSSACGDPSWNADEA